MTYDDNDENVEFRNKKMKNYQNYLSIDFLLEDDLINEKIEQEAKKPLPLLTDVLHNLSSFEKTSCKIFR